MWSVSNLLNIAIMLVLVKHCWILLKLFLWDLKSFGSFATFAWQAGVCEGFVEEMLWEDLRVECGTPLSQKAKQRRPQCGCHTPWLPGVTAWAWSLQLHHAWFGVNMSEYFPACWPKPQHFNSSPPGLEEVEGCVWMCEILQIRN